MAFPWLPFDIGSIYLGRRVEELQRSIAYDGLLFQGHFTDLVNLYFSYLVLHSSPPPFSSPLCDIADDQFDLLNALIYWRHLIS